MNKQILLGRVGKQPEVVGAENKVTKFSVATSERWSKNGEKQERTDWHSVIAFGKTGETLAKYLNKGDQIYLEGKTRHNKYADKNGIERWATDVEVLAFEFIGGKKESQVVEPSAELTDDLPF